MQALDHEDDQMVPVEEFVRLKSHVHTLAVVHDLLTKGVQEREDAQFLSSKQVLDRLLPMLQQTAWKHDVRFEVADAPIPSKQCVSLALVINELVSNAIKHGRTEAEVTFEVRGAEAALEVCDDGAGFPPDFDALARANTGLDLVESLVRTDLAGQVCYGNRAQGGGRVQVVFDIPTCGAA
jgi:two-component sensor histidine kinase